MPAFDTEISNSIRNLLVNAKTVIRILFNTYKNVTDAIHSEIEGTIESKIWRFCSKHTYVKGLSRYDSGYLINSSWLVSHHKQ